MCEKGATMSDEITEKFDELEIEHSIKLEKALRLAVNSLFSESTTINRPRKAYYVEESVKGHTTWLVHAQNIREARKIYYEGEACDSQMNPNGISSVKRAPEEDDDR